MKIGENMNTANHVRRTGRRGHRTSLAFPRGMVRLSTLLFCLAMGCAHDRAGVEKNLMADRDSAARSQGVADCYRVAYPDVLEIETTDRPDLGGTRPIDLGGR